MKPLLLTPVNRFRKCIVTAFALMLVTGCGFAATIYTAALNGATETPVNASTASGFATLTLTGNSLFVDISFNGLSMPAAAAHIHCCVPPGTNTGVSLPFPGFPAVTTSASDYTNTFDLTLLNVYTAGFLAANGGTAAGAEAALIAGLNSGKAYVNIHDSLFPGGEIRGFAAVVTPEPATIGLCAAALVGLAFRKRK